mgnify:CR=1 FL=1
MAFDLRPPSGILRKNHPPPKKVAPPRKKAPPRRVPPTKTARTQAAAAAAAPSTTAANGGSYSDALNNEGIYTADRADLTAQSVADRAQRDAAVKALNFQYNDPNNPFSTVSGLGRERDLSRGNMNADRASRGVLASGGTKLGEEQIGYDYSKGMYDAQNQVNSQIGSLDQQFADSERGRMNQQQSMLAEAQQRMIDAGIYPGGGGGDGASPGPAIGTVQGPNQYNDPSNPVSKYFAPAGSRFGTPLISNQPYNRNQVWRPSGAQQSAFNANDRRMAATMAVPVPRRATNLAAIGMMKGPGGTVVSKSTQWGPAGPAKTQLGIYGR